MGLHALAPAQRRLLAVAVLLVVALVFGLRHLHGGRAAAPSATFAPLTVAAPAHSAAAAGGKLLVVDVAGAVRRPGLYRLAAGTRIADAVARAGGAGPKADLDLVNLAAPLADGEQVVVPQRGAVAAGSGEPSPTAPLDLNSASAEQLDALPGIGPETAAKIVAFREAHGPFRTVEGLDAVPGIGPSRIDQLKGLVIP
jgi:competence protein ComEA